jgi:hypothetical protein
MDIEDMPDIGGVLAGRLRKARIAAACGRIRLGLASAARSARRHTLDKDWRAKLAAEANAGS